MGRKPTGVRDLLELPRPAPTTPWAYVKVAEGCDRACAFCAIPSFRGKQRSRTIDSIEAEVRSLVDGGVAEIVLVAQDLAWYGRDIGEPGSLAPLLRRLDRLAPRGLARVRLLYLYPSEVRDPLLVDDARAADGRPVLRPLAAARVGAAAAQHEAVGERRPLPRPDRAHPRRRAATPRSARRSSSASRARPSPTTTSCSRSSREVRLDWAGFFPFSHRGRHARGDARRPDPRRARGRAAARVQRAPGPDHPGRTRRARRRDGRGAGRRRRRRTPAALVGRTHREAPEIDGVVRVTGDAFARPGALVPRRSPAPKAPT